MLLPVQDKNSKMERNKKAIVGLVLTSLLVFSVVPYFNVRAQTCDPDALVPVKYGQRGNAVRNAQACLIEAGYDIPAGATGYYGAQTRNAVREFYADWYGAWSGNSLGPRGVAELKSRLAAAPSQPSQPTQPTQPTTGVSQEQLQQVLNLLSQGKTNEALALLLTLLGQQATATTATPTTPTTAEEGFLTVEQDPSVVAVTLREGETGKVFGLRMRADNGDVTVQSVFLRYATTSSVAPYRTISKIEVVDEQGNVLFSRNVDNTTFYQDSNLNYYLPVTGLNFKVPKNTYKSLFVRVTVVGTLPSNATTSGFYVNANDVRGVDGAGVQRFAPSGTISQNFTLQPAIAGQADWVVARNVNTPKEGYIFGSIVDGKLYNQKVLSIDVTAKYDSLRMTSLSGSVSGNATVTAVYLRYGNQTLASSPVSSGSFTFNVTPANFTINRDQTVTLDIYADFANGTTSPATSSVTVTSVSGQNSLGDTKSKSVSVDSDVMHYLTVGPQFVFRTPTTQYTPPSQTASSSYTVTFEFDVTPVNGNITMGTTTGILANFADVKLQKDNGNTAPPNGGVTVNVYQGSTDVTNSLTVDATSTYFVLSQGQTYTFKITAVQNGAPPSLGTGLYRWIVDSIKWRLPGSSATPYEATWTERQLVTGYTNVQ
jgi:hypothetical protein